MQLKILHKAEMPHSGLLKEKGYVTYENVMNRLFYMLHNLDAGLLGIIMTPSTTFHR